MKAGSRSPLHVGVTLIELLVAVVVIGLVVAVSIPAYRHHVLRVKHGDATRELALVALRLQACHKRTGSYASLDDVPNACVALPYTVPEGTYRISGDIKTDEFLVTATPLESQTADTQCRAFTLDHQGRQGITGNGAPVDCWGRQN
jgi:type IV pilus assembly protein PilE